VRQLGHFAHELLVLPAKIAGRELLREHHELHRAREPLELLAYRLAIALLQDSHGLIIPVSLLASHARGPAHGRPAARTFSCLASHARGPAHGRPAARTFSCLASHARGPAHGRPAARTTGGEPGRRGSG